MASSTSTMSLLKLIMVLLTIVTSIRMMPRVPTTAGTRQTHVPPYGATHPIEHCLRKAINPPPPPSPTASTSDLKLMDFFRVLCRDSFRHVSHDVQVTGKLPSQYMEALCNIYGDDQEKVEGFVNSAFFNYKHPQELMNGETCSTLKEKKMQHFAPRVWEDESDIGYVQENQLYYSVK
ncbi:hypothetical protein PIB30_090442 [Stylosanthes scabra]|uniref:Uncharacterized protein n=1 Tax=Stylosanthes scabra TaxID=79078 RepID=A0ABU6RU78_9FABA|nr:hypothetical protein [Stylosanthes scabra]